MIGFTIVLLIGIMCLITLKIVNKSLINVSGIFVLIWTISLSLSCLSLYGMNKPSGYVVFLGLLSIIIFTLFGCLYKRKKKIVKCEIKEHAPISKKSIIYILTIVAYVYIFPFLKKSIALVLSEGWSYLRYASGLDSYGSTAQLMIIQYFVQSLFIVTIMVTCIDLINKKFVIPSLIISLLDIIIYSLLFGGRYIVLYLLVFIGFLLLQKSKGKIVGILKKYRFLSLLLLCGVIMIIWISLQRSANSFLKSLYVYFCGPHAYLSYLIDNSIITNMNFMGLNQFGFIYNFIYSALTALFGIEYRGTNHLISQATSQMVSIGDAISYNSLGSCLESFICDFGLIFAPIGIVLFAWSMHFIEKQYDRKKTPISLAFYLYSIFIVVNSVLSYSLGSPGALVVICLIPVFARQKVGKKNGKKVKRANTKDIGDIVNATF